MRYSNLADFARVAAADELAPGQVMAARLDDRLITLANVNGEYYAFSVNCPHKGAAVRRYAFRFGHGRWQHVLVPSEPPEPARPGAYS